MVDYIAQSSGYEFHDDLSKLKYAVTVSKKFGMHVLYMHHCFGSQTTVGEIYASKNAQYLQNMEEVAKFYNSNAAVLSISEDMFTNGLKLPKNKAKLQKYESALKKVLPGFQGFDQAVTVNVDEPFEFHVA